MTFSFNGFSALMKSIAKTKRITKLVEEARNSSAIRLIYYKELIENSRTIHLPKVEYAKEQLVVIVHVSARQIPAWFRFRESLLLTVNSKINYHALEKEPLNGQEVAVHIEETNIYVDKITVK